MEVQQQKPMCSVVMPAYNSERFIADALDSALGQTLHDIEILVVDDCSKDKTAEIVAHYAESDQRVKYLKQEQRMGAAAARNRAIAAARADWIAFLDSDDIWLSDKLERQMIYCLEADTSLCFTAARFINDDGSHTNRIPPIPLSVDYAHLLRGNVMVTSSVVTKKESLLHYPMERDDLHEDYITWLRILKHYGPATGIDEPLVHYRLTHGSKSRSKLKSAKKTWGSYRLMGLSFPKASIVFLGYIRHGLKRYYI